MSGRHGSEIGEHGGVKFARDRPPLFEQDFFDRITVDGHAENGLRHRRRLGSAVGFANTAGLAALAGRHLRLDHARTDGGEGGFGLRGRSAQDAARHGN